MMSAKIEQLSLLPRVVQAGEVPACIWPAANEWGIPDLDPTMQAGMDWIGSNEFQIWGAVPRTTVHRGTWLFYTHDYRYTALWSDPRPIVNSQCRAAVEPNFSCYADTPRAVALWRIYQKRWLARWWQTQGIRIWVDLNVAPAFLEWDFLGVPLGWRAYATRGYVARFEETVREYERARAHAGGEIDFLVYGGSRRLTALCEARGWRHICEVMDERKAAKRKGERWQKAAAA